MTNTYFFYICAIANYILCFVLMKGKSFNRRKNLVMLLMVINCLLCTLVSFTGNKQVAKLFFSSMGDGMIWVSNYFYHGLHCSLPWLVFLYVVHLAGLRSHITKRWQTLCLLPMLFFYALLIFNPVTGFVFRVEDHAYVRGTGILFEYGVAVIYLFMILGIIIRYRKAIGNKYLVGLVFFIAANAVGVLLQFAFQGLTVELFTESLGFLGILATSENESDLKDSVTGLYNRNAFEEDCGRLINASVEFSAIVFRFANYNHVMTTIGINNTNDILKEVATWIMTYAGRRDYLYHIGNGEFVVTRMKKDGTLNYLANRIHEKYNTYVQHNGISVSLVPEIFVIRIPRDADTLDAMIAICETDYVSRQEGGFVLSGDNLKVTKRGYEVEAAIRRGLKNKAFKVFYQPIYDAKNKKINSAEALARYTDPLLGFIAPEEFVSVAEKAGLIPDIGLSVFETVCRDLSDGSLDRAGIEFIELNVSPVQCLKKDLDADFLAVMKKYGTDIDRINLEITESASDMGSALSKENIRNLKKAGFKFSLDDYGTGISNISSLYELDFSIIKIDRTILWNARFDEKSKLILDSIINMIHGLSLDIVAEGVESEEQVRYLKDKNVKYHQGFYYARPLEKEKFVRFCMEYNTKRDDHDGRSDKDMKAPDR
ncbi:MAG: EAL domain-containing protein [Lachnospiraceae bacterium]|nr:EAL domain-containing protein [Lachnospiraceae bacterium]